MAYQKCIIWLTDGTKLVYEGDVQYDTDARPKIRKVQFTVPIDDEFTAEDDKSGELPEFFKNMFGGSK